MNKINHFNLTKMSLRKLQITALLDIPFISLILKYDYFLEGIPRLVHHEKHPIQNIALLLNNKAVYIVCNLVKIINLHTGVIERILEDHEGYIDILAVNNNLIATTSKDSLKIWDLTTENYIYNLEETIGKVSVMIFHDKYLYYDTDNKIIRLDPFTCKEMIYNLNTDKKVRHLFIMNNRLIVVSGIINIFDLLTGELLYTLGDYITYIKQIDENHIISSSYYAGNKIYNIITGQSEFILKDIAISHILILPDKRLVILSDCGRINILEALDKKQYVLDCRYNLIKHMALLFDDNIITGGNENVLRVWNPNTCKLLFTMKGTTGERGTLTVTNMGVLISTDERGNLTIWQ